MQAARRRRIRDLTLGLSGIVVSAAVAVAVVWVNIDRMQATDREVFEAREDIVWADAANDAANDQANALGALVATHDRRFVEPLLEGRQRLDASLASLAAAGAGAPEQRGRIAALEQTAKAWSADYAQPAIDAAQSGQAWVETPSMALAAHRTLDRIQALIDDVKQGETVLLRQRQAALASAYVTSRLALVAGSTVALALVLLIVGRSARQLIHERRLAEADSKRLAEALDAAQAAESAKTRFLANMSHEMRTPLNGVTGMSDALINTKLEPQQRELVDAIRFSAMTLDHLIADLLSLASHGVRIHAAAPSIRFNLRAATLAIARPFAADAAARGVALEITAGADVDIDVDGDAASLGQLLSCLLSNAVKFTEAGAVRLTVRHLAEDRYAFEVSDTGVGFDETRKDEMFQAFIQSDDSETRRYGGAGLGLPLAWRLAEELGGSLDAHSTPGVGSTFTFEAVLPAAAPDTAAAVPEAAPLRVLIVDDNATNRKVLELILEPFGVAWRSVADGQQAVEAFRAEAFTAILMDVQMPVMDGLTATREIRRLEREQSRPTTPVIIVSANCQPEHVAAGQAAGAQRHLGKPVSAQVLIETLQAVLSERTAIAA